MRALSVFGRFFVFPVVLVVFSCAVLFASPSPDLPGVEITDSEIALDRSQALVRDEARREDAFANKGWVAPSLEEQLNQDETDVGMGQGAIFVPRFTETRLEPDYSAVKTDSMSKDYAGRVWVGKPGVRLALPFGEYRVVMGSGGMDKLFEYEVRVEEGKTTLVPPVWGGLVINTINEDGEFVSESYEIFSVGNGESYGKGFGLTQERITDIKTWILPPQLYRISRSGENVSSIVNYITVQVNPGELSHVELVFEESTGRLVAGGVQRLRMNASRDSYWTYGLRVGGSASYTTAMTVNGQKNYVWNALGDLRLRALYNRSKVFWLTELYARENMQWLNEDNLESQWSVAQDLLQLQSSVVYRLYEWIGPYARVSAKTHIFPEYYRIGVADTMVYRRFRDGTEDGLASGDIRISPPFDPLRIGEGAGLNLHSMVSSSVDVSAQTGVAARQTVRKRILIPIGKDPVVFMPTNSNIYDYGWENSVNFRLSFRFLTLDLTGEVFFPNWDVKNYVVEDLSLELRLALTRFLELAYQQQLVDRVATGFEEAEGERFESLNTVQLRLYVNF